MTHYRLAFSGPIHDASAIALSSRIAAIFERSDAASLCVLFSSEGGSTVQSLALYNFIRSLPRPLQMHAVGHVGSAAVPVFLAGHKRTCTPFSRFFFHRYDWTFEGAQTLDGLEEARIRLENDIEFAREIAAERTKIPRGKLHGMYRNAATPTIYSADEAKNAGIVEEILMLNGGIGTEETNTAVWTVGW